MLRVFNKGEPTVYFVESNTLQCVNPECGKTWNRLHRYQVPRGQRDLTRLLKIGDCCPCCGADLDVRFHTVDIGAYGGVGRCSCEFFQMSPKMEKRLCAMSRSQQRDEAEKADSRCRCQHIAAARSFALNLALRVNGASWGGEEE